MWEDKGSDGKARTPLMETELLCKRESCVPMASTPVQELETQLYSVLD